MASGATIRVCVLEGQYAQLSNLGFPVSLVMELQQGGLRLGNAKWSSRLSDAGFSVSFFWPVAWTTQRRRHRRRGRKSRANPDSENFTTTAVSKQQHKSPPIPTLFSRESTLASRQPVLLELMPTHLVLPPSPVPREPRLQYFSQLPRFFCDYGLGRQ